jgi:hypothetical protein
VWGDERNGSMVEGRQVWRVAAASGECIEHLRARTSEIARVTRGNGEIVLERRGGDHAIQKRQLVLPSVSD